MKPTLVELGKKYSSDKLYWHSYFSDSGYPKLFQELKHPVKKVLELGIGHADLMRPFLPPDVEYQHGSSLRIWRDYFPEASIYGCDIRPDTIFNEERISTMICDLRDPYQLGLLAGGFGPFFDLIIDDASHSYEDQHLAASFLRHSATQMYVIEDVFADKGQLLAAAFGGELWRGEKGRDDNMVVIRR